MIGLALTPLLHYSGSASARAEWGIASGEATGRIRFRGDPYVTNAHTQPRPLRGVVVWVALSVVVFIVAIAALCVRRPRQHGEAVGRCDARMGPDGFRLEIQGDVVVNGDPRLEDQVIKRMMIMRAAARNGGEYAYFCRGVQDHVCDAPYSSMERVERAIEAHFKTIQLGAEFIAAVREQLEEAVADKARAQQLLRQQLENQLRQLAVKEENLIDLAADGELPTPRIKVKLHEISRARDKLTVRLGAVEQDLSGALAYIEAHLQLLADPYELYRRASDDTRRQLNQAFFHRIHVVNDEVVGDELTSPLLELPAAQRGWTALEAGEALETAEQQSETWRQLC